VRRREAKEHRRVGRINRNKRKINKNEKTNNKSNIIIKVNKKFREELIAYFPFVIN
jgi:hypothetical protein